MNEKIVSERCIGYQNVASGTNSVYEQKLENGKKQWQAIGMDKNNVPIYYPIVDEKPRIDITQEAKSE